MSTLPLSRTAVVTGAGSPAGIGRKVAAALAAAGWAVALVDANAEGLATAEAELRQQGATALAVPLDITDEAAIEAAYALSLIHI